MRNAYFIVLLLATTLSGGTASARGSTLLDGEESGVRHPTPQGIPVGGFSKELFKFNKETEDDGKSEPGGWQKASTNLNFGMYTDETLDPRAD